MLIKMKQGMGTQRCIYMVHQIDVGGIVQTASFCQQACISQQLLGMLMTFFCEQYLMGFFIYAIVARAIFCFLFFCF